MQAVTLQSWLESQNASADVSSALDALAEAAVQIADAVEAAPLRGHLGEADNVNVQGEDQKILDVTSNTITLEVLEKCPSILALVSEEEDHVIANPGAGAGAHLAVCFDPLDGSSNIETSGTIGTIFSVLDLPSGATADAPSVLGALDKQVAAGYFLYGAATLLVVTTGTSVAKFAYHPASNKFELAMADITIPKAAAEFSINMAHGQYWQPAVRAYIDECLVGKSGPRGKTFNMRWAGAMVADVHRVFIRGGIFIYPALNKPGSENGKLRLLYEGLPISMLVKVAGGKTVAGDVDFDKVVATSIHQRTPLALGSTEEVDQLLKKFAEFPA